MSNFMEVLSIIWLSQKELSVNDIAKESGLEKKQVRRALYEMVKNSLVKVRRVEGKLGTGEEYAFYSTNPVKSRERVTENMVTRYRRGEM